MNISILASIWCQNLWDELILKNEIRIIEDMYKDKSKERISFRVFTYDVDDIFYKKKNIEYLEYFPIWIRNVKNIIRNIKNSYLFLKTIIWSDLIVIWWGWLFFDSELQKNKNPLNLWLYRIYLIRLFRKKITFYWVWIDIKNKENLKKIKIIFYWAYKIYIRDKNSQKILKDLEIDSEIILDPVFLDNKNLAKDKTFKKNYCLENIKANDFDLSKIKSISFKNKKVWIALRKGYIKKWKKKEFSLIKELLNTIIKWWWKVILLPHSFHKSDDVANDYKFLKQFSNKNIEITKNIKETYETYNKNKLDMCISWRLHSIILSQVYKINFLAIDYSKKTQEILNTIKKS